MSRFDGKLEAAGAASADDLPLLLSLLGTVSDFPTAAERQQAIVCLLSATDGWREASRRLNGAFAEEPAESRLTSGKEE